MALTVQGRYKQTSSTTGKCKGRKDSCGEYPGPDMGSIFVFPDYFPGPFPKGTKKNAQGRMEVVTERIIPLDDFCDDDPNSLNAIFLFKG